MITNPIPTQPETLSPCPMDHPIVNGVRFTDFSNEYKQHIWCYDCGLEFEGRVDETAESVAQRWNTRRAAVTAPRGDVATTARNRDVAQRVVMSTESVLGERFDIATRHELADRITAALDAATSSLHSAERESPILAFEKWLTRYVTDCGKLSQTEYSIAYAAFIAAHPGEGPLARTMNDPAPAERTRVEGEQGTWYCLDCDSQQPIEGAWMCSDGNVRCAVHRQQFSGEQRAAAARADNEAE